MSPFHSLLVRVQVPQGRHHHGLSSHRRGHVEDEHVLVLVLFYLCYVCGSFCSRLQLHAHSTPRPTGQHLALQRYIQSRRFVARVAGARRQARVRLRRQSLFTKLSVSSVSTAAPSSDLVKNRRTLSCFTSRSAQWRSTPDMIQQTLCSNPRRAIFSFCLRRRSPLYQVQLTGSCCLVKVQFSLALLQYVWAVYSFKT